MVISGHLLILEHLVTDRQACRGHWHSKVWNYETYICRFMPRLMITFNIDLSTRFINILQLESAHTLSAKGGSMILRTNEWHAPWHRLYICNYINTLYLYDYIFLRINMHPQVFHHIVFNPKDSQRTFCKCWKVSAQVASHQDSWNFWMSGSVLVFKLESQIKGNWPQVCQGLDLEAILQFLSLPNVCIPQSSAIELKNWSNFRKLLGKKDQCRTSSRRQLLILMYAVKIW